MTDQLIVQILRADGLIMVEKNNFMHYYALKKFTKCIMLHILPLIGMLIQLYLRVQLRRALEQTGEIYLAQLWPN